MAAPARLPRSLGTRHRQIHERRRLVLLPFLAPKYLYDARGFDIKSASTFVWIPYAFSGIGSLCGGWFSSRLIRSGHTLNFSRKLALGASAAVMPWILFITH